MARKPKRSLDPSVEDWNDAEARLAATPYIAEAAVIHDGATGDGRPVVVAAPDEAALVRDEIVALWYIARFGLQRSGGALPESFRPARYHLVPGPLPRDQQGQIDRPEIRRRLESGLPEWKPGACTASLRDRPRVDEPVRPQDGVEQAVLSAVASVAREAPAPRPGDHLGLDLGLDSLDRLAALCAVEEATGRRLPDEALTTPTVAALADAARVAPPGSPRPFLERATNWIDGADDGLLDRVIPRSRLLRPGRVAIALSWRIWSRLKLEQDVVGLERIPRNTPVILCPNHISVLDPFFTVSVLPAAIRERLWNFGAEWIFESRLGPGALLVGRTLPVDNLKGRFLPGLRNAARVLERGGSMSVFPEGMRSLGDVGPFRAGAAVLSLHAGAPLVPVAIGGLERVLGLGATQVSSRDEVGRRRRIRIEFGEPVPPVSVLSGESPLGAARRGTEEVRRRVIAMLEAFPRELTSWLR